MMGLMALHGVFSGPNRSTTASTPWRIGDASHFLPRSCKAPSPALGERRLVRHGRTLARHGSGGVFAVSGRVPPVLDVARNSLRRCGRDTGAAANRGTILVEATC